MGTLTIRNLDDDTKRALRLRAAQKGVSMEQEVRTILREATSAGRPQKTGKWRLKASREDILALGRKPDRLVHLKPLSDQLWDEGSL